MRKILDATVKLLYTTQPRELSTRRLAREAQVIIAAINYSFHGKDEMINEAVKDATAAAFEMGMRLLLAPGKPPADRLREFLHGYATGLVRFPGLARTAFLALFLKESGETFYGRFMKEMVENVGQIIGEMRGAAGGSAEDASNAALMVLSSVIFPFLVTRSIRDAGAVSYEDGDARRRCIDNALAGLVGAENKEEQE